MTNVAAVRPKTTTPSGGGSSSSSSSGGVAHPPSGSSVMAPSSLSSSATTTTTTAAAMPATGLGVAIPAPSHLRRAYPYQHVVIMASPSRRTSLLQRQVSRALEIIDLFEEGGAAATTRGDDTDGPHRVKASAATTTVAVPQKKQPPPATSAPVGLTTVAKPPSSAIQISPTVVKRKRSHSMSSVGMSGHGSSLAEDLRVSIDLIDKATRKRLGKSQNGRVTPSKRCGGKDKKKKQKIDVIDRALKRFRADRAHDSERCFEFDGICNAPASGSARAEGTAADGARSRESDESTAIRVHVGVAAAQGARAYMEDRYSVTARLFAEYDDGELMSPASLLAIYDGHNGAGAAEYASSRFRELLADNDYLLDLCRRPTYETLGAEEVAHVRTILRDAFAAVDEEILELTMSENKRDGSTVLLGLLLGGKFFVANVGDSRGVWANGDNDVARVTVDHKPNLAAETAWIEEAGGKVIFSGCWRVAHDEIPLRLAVSRALGDHPLKTNLPVSCSGPLVSVVPDIQVLDIAGDDDVVVFASDGLWDRLSDEEAIEIARERMDEFGARPPAQRGQRSAVQSAANALVETALLKRSMDNITAMVIRFATTPSVPATVDAVEYEEGTI